MPEDVVAVIDIGSNSIKLLVATLESKSCTPLYQKTLETRISQGISKAVPLLSESAIEAGTAAVAELIQDGQVFKPSKVQIVATSAVRDAQNRAHFMASILKATGHPLTVLTGDQEAAYIAAGVATDPSLERFDSMTLSDLGGGSLECIAFVHKEIRQKVSLPLGAVRLTEQFVENPALPLDAGRVEAIASYVKDTLEASGFGFSDESAVLVGTGGGLNISRAIRAHELGIDYEQVEPFIELTYLETLFERLAGLSLEERTQIEGLPPTRADILPVGLLTLITLAQCHHAKGFYHSMRNLRFGIAAELLSKVG